MREVAIESNDANKQVSVRYALEGIDEARSVALDGARIGKSGGLTLRTADDLTSFDVDGAQPEHPVAVELSASGSNGSRSERFQNVPIGGGRPKSFNVEAWKRLGPDSLTPGTVD